MRILFECNSVYQIFNAVNIRLNMEKESAADIIVSDICPNHTVVAKNLKETGLFENVFALKSKFIARQQYKMTRYTVYGYRIFPMLILKKIGWPGNIKYDKFYFANHDRFNEILYLNLHAKNKNIKTFFFEDGGTSYIMDYKNIDGVEEKLMKFGIKSLGADDSVKLLYEPDIYCMKDNAKVEAIPKISSDDKAFIDAINKTFGIETVEQLKEKTVFFEESFLADGIENNDEDLIRMVHKYFKDEFVLKPHPRNPRLRFDENEFKIMKTSIPWEVYCLNQNLEGKLLCTISSNAAISPHIIFENAPKTVLLLNMLEGFSILTSKPEFFEYISRIKDLYPNDIFIPNNKEELMEVFNNES